MKKVYTGKTKDVYLKEDGIFVLKFKDDCTGADGVFDPGMNTVGLQIAGSGKAGLRLTAHFMKILKTKGIKTHFIDSNIDKGEMTVKSATPFGKGVEVICRFRAVGSFYRRYGDYISEGTVLPAYVEMTLKDDIREDPLITKDALAVLGIMTEKEYETITAETRKIASVIKNELAEKNIELYDIKFEFGKVDGEILLIDEISGGNMRAFENGCWLMPLELTKRVLGE